MWVLKQLDTKTHAQGGRERGHELCRGGEDQNRRWWWITNSARGDEDFETNAGSICLASVVSVEYEGSKSRLGGLLISGARKPIHSELWHACAGPLVSLPQVGTLVYYFPQGHSEQVCISLCFIVAHV
ncbi:hypothetical protein Droror1_Dr00013723 [Drosera rotundifolia]